MRKPGFVTLARLDDTRFITACRHGMVHLTWRRSTVRFSREEFRDFASLLHQVVDAAPPASLTHRDLRVTADANGTCSLEIGCLTLHLTRDELTHLSNAVRAAVHRLDRILSSGVWDEEEPEAPAGLPHAPQQYTFSRN